MKELCIHTTKSLKQAMDFINSSNEIGKLLDGNQIKGWLLTDNIYRHLVTDIQEQSKIIKIYEETNFRLRQQIREITVDIGLI